MSQRAKMELVTNWRPKYQRVGRRYKSKILDEFCCLTGHDRKHAIKLMRGKTGIRRNAPGRKKLYGKEVIEPLRDIWALAEYPCSKLLAAMLPEWLGYYEEKESLGNDDVRRKILNISPSQIDRLLKPYRVKRSRWQRRGCKPGSLLRQQIPIRTGPWDAQTKPGYMEMDTVAHCGESMAGSFVWSLTATDIRTGWTCLRSVWNCGQHGITERIREIEQVLPFPWLGADCDNGHEFLNKYVRDYFRQRPRPIEFTRSRAYHKNDNAHVEQKNWTHVRLWFGYHRLENCKVVALMNELYTSDAWRLYHNFFLPSVKLIEKKRVASKTVKRYDKPKTPYQRVLESPDVSAHVKHAFKEQYVTANPFQFRKTIEQKLKEIFALCYPKTTKR